MSDDTSAAPDSPASEVLTPADRGKMVRQLLKQAENVDLPFDNRATAVHSLRVEFPADPDVESVDEAYQEAVRSKGTESYRGYVANLSPKSAGGQKVLQRLRKAVLGALKPPKAEPSAVKPPREKKGPQNQCCCGCGALVHNLFAPGHDAKVHGVLIKVSRGQLPLDAIPEGIKPHLKDVAQRWKLPTDADGNLAVVPPVQDSAKDGDASKAGS